MLFQGLEPTQDRAEVNLATFSRSAVTSKHRVRVLHTRRYQRIAQSDLEHRALGSRPAAVQGFDATGVVPKFRLSLRSPQLVPAHHDHATKRQTEKSSLSRLMPSGRIRSGRTHSVVIEK